MSRRDECGLGLYTSKLIVDELGGTIEYRETPEGETEFSFKVPVSIRDEDRYRFERIILETELNIEIENMSI